jgi:ribosomal protein S18 acetylase RimI-like enzyme
MEIRPYRPEDEAAVLKIAKDGISVQERLARQLGLMPGDEYVDWDAKKACTSLKQRPGDWWVAVEGPKIIGVMRVELRAERGYWSIQEVDVDSAHQRAGVASRLLREAEHVAATSPTPKLGAGVLANNDASKRLLESHGFTVLGATERHGKPIFISYGKRLLPPS